MPASPSELPIVNSAPRDGAAIELAVPAEKLQSQLEEVLVMLQAETRNRESLSCMVHSLERRLDEGLHSVGEVTNARMAADGATDAMLLALRRCVNELGESCAWPPTGAAQDQQVASTLAQAVLQQQTQLDEMKASQVQLLAECQELSHKERRLPQRVDEAMLQDLPARHAAMAQVLESLQGKVEEAAAGRTWNDTSSMTQQMQAIQGQLQQLQGDRGPGAAEYGAFVAEVQGRLQDMHQQLMAASAVSGSSLASQPPEAAAKNVQSMELQLQAWQGEKSQITETIQSIMEQQRQIQLVQQQQQQELHAALARAQNDEEHAKAVQELRAEVTVIANAVKMLCGRVEEISAPEPPNALMSMVSRLSERVEKLEPREPPQLSLALAQQRNLPPVEAGESAQNLRQQVSTLMGSVSWLSNSTTSAALGPGALGSGVLGSGALGRTSLSAAGAKASLVDSLVRRSSSRAPSPRKWLSEPLSVSVARTDLPSSTSSPLGTALGGLGSALATEQQLFARSAAATAHGRDF